MKPTESKAIIQETAKHVNQSRMLKMPKTRLKGKWLKLWNEHKRKMGGLCICGLEWELLRRQNKTAIAKAEGRTQ